MRQPQGKRERETPVVTLRNEAVLTSNRFLVECEELGR